MKNLGSVGTDHSDLFTDVDRSNNEGNVQKAAMEKDKLFRTTIEVYLNGANDLYWALSFIACFVFVFMYNRPRRGPDVVRLHQPDAAGDPIMCTTRPEFTYISSCCMILPKFHT